MTRSEAFPSKVALKILEEGLGFDEEELARVFWACGGRPVTLPRFFELLQKALRNELAVTTLRQGYRKPIPGQGAEFGDRGYGGYEGSCGGDGG